MGLLCVQTMGESIMTIWLAAVVAMLTMVFLDAVHPPGGAAMRAASNGFTPELLITTMLVGTVVVLLFRYISIYVQRLLPQKNKR